MSFSLRNGLKLITLLTDFGIKDGYPGIMKGVIWGIDAQIQIADITHHIPAQNILTGSIVLNRSFDYFPAGSVHIAVVDPGVGTQRMPMAARLGEHFFVLPDNGLITLPLQKALERGWPTEFYHLDQPKYWLTAVSNVFHGRDIFAPSGAHLARGVPINELGTRIERPVTLELPQAERTAEGWRTQVLDVDHFGNLITGLSAKQIDPLSVQRVRVAGVEIPGLVKTFGSGKAGDLVALIDSDNRLSIAVVNGNAAERLAAQPGDQVDVVLNPGLPKERA
jgi:S-adenosylmethionine hydrolase